MVQVEGVEEHMMVIIKIIAEVKVVSEAEVGEEVMEEVMEGVSTIKPKIKIREIIKPKVTTIKLKTKIKQMMVVTLGSPLVIITKDRRGPFCFHCERSGADYNHWPYQCDWLEVILDDWHANLNATGHQKESQKFKQLGSHTYRWCSFTITKTSTIR